MNCEDIARLSPLYLSGELDGPNALEYREHLRNCYACAGKLEEQTRLDGVLRTSVLSDEIDNSELDLRVQQHLASNRSLPPRHWVVAAAAIVAILLTGALAYRTMYDLESTRLCDAAAQDHSKEVTGRQSRRWLSDPIAIAALAQRNGIPGSLVARLAPVGYKLEHGKLCRLDGRIFLHLVYVQGNHECSTYLRPLPDVFGGKSIQRSETHHEYVAYFQNSKLGAIFVTDQSEAAVMSVAHSAARLL